MRPISKYANDCLAWVKMVPPPTIDRLEWEARVAWVLQARDYAQWSWFLTLTFRADVAEDTALDAFRWWLRELSRREFRRQHFKFARVLDRQSCGRLHFHVLVECPPEIAPPPEWQRALDLWEHIVPREFCAGRPGRNHGAFYYPDTAEGTPLYLFAKHGGGHELNVACPRPRTGPCQRGGCAQARTGWID